jgi:hypothetical protein
MVYRFKAILLLILAALLVGCGKTEQIKGKEFIDREVLVDVLVDIHLVDGITNDRKFHRKYEVDEIDLLTPILEKYQVSRSMLDTTLAEYSRNPELFDQVYNDVLIKLNIMLDENDQEVTNIPEE